MDTIEKLNRVNASRGILVHSVQEACFHTYGRVVNGYSFEKLIEYMEKYTEIPQEGNIYCPSVEALEKMQVTEQIKNQIYGQMEIQVGYCNGKNTTFNGMEYHKGSEINIAVTDFCLFLGHTWDIVENTYKVKQAEVFFVEKGTAIEMYQTTLHLSPCKVQKEGFKGIVILPKGTNTPLTGEKKQVEELDRLLLQKNKWVIAHSEREPLIKQGAFPGIIGENKALYYE